ncbi:MAG: PAS domain S-box protein, partial [Candidatus Methanoperedens sp.]|nr:PAS domain S-box protein [Candidatus Methanoperedens sp.]
LVDFAPELILADYTLPSFDGCSALRIAKEKCPDVPFIFVSGTIGEDFAIESLKSGATDYIIKDRLSRLAPAVHRALSEVGEKIEYRKAEKALKESELRFRSVVQSANDAIILMDGRCIIFSWNTGAQAMFGYMEKEVIGKSISHIIPERYKKDHIKKIECASLAGKPGINRKRIESYGLRKGGIEFPVDISMATWKTEEGTFYSAIIRDITERVQAEKEKDRLLKAIDNSNDGIIISDEKDRYIYLNEAYAKIYGYSEEELIGETWRKLVPSELIDATGLELERTIHNKKIGMLSGEFPGVRKDGTIIPTEVRGTGLWDENGIYQGHICIVRDIAERKRAEEKLRLFRSLTDQSNDAIFVSDPETGRILDANDKACANLGYKREELFNMRVMDFEVNLPDQFSWQEHVKEVQGRGHLILEGGHRRKDGTIFPIEVNVSFIVLEKISYILAVVRDITERKQAEEALRESEERLHQAVGVSQIGIFDHDHRTGTIYWSPEQRHIYGWSPEEPVTLPAFLKHVHPDDRERIVEAVRRAHDPAGNGTFDVEHRIVDRNGAIHWLSTRSRTHFEGEGSSCHPVRTVGASADLTERKRAEEKIEASLKEKETLLREIHHRVKNNMQIVSSLLGLQAESIKEEKYLEMFRDSRNRIMSMYIIHEKLYRSRDLEKIEFNEYIRDLANGLLQSHGVEAGKVELNINVGDTSLGIDFAIPCGLIINELITNSLKYAFPDGREGKISILLHPLDKNMFELAVSDNGVGFPGGVDFRKTESLGLRLVTILAENQLHGQIDLNRTGGTEFRIKFKGVK